MPDATNILNQIAGALDTLANVPTTIISDDRTFMEIWGWNMPAMNRHEFAALIRSPIPALQKLHGTEVDDVDFQELTKIPGNIAFIQAQAINNVAGGNAFHVYIVVDSLLKKIGTILQKYQSQVIDLDEIEDKNLLPPKLILELRQVAGQLDKAKAGVKDADSKIKAISDAYNAATNLPAELSSMQIARDGYLALQATLNENMAASDLARRGCEDALRKIGGIEGEAQKLLQNTKGVFAAATTTGLGKEFYQKAQDLSYHVRLLSAGLLGVLVVAAVITFLRVNEIHEVVAQKPLSLDLVWANVIAMFASLAAPVWLAWLLTRQIGQRFRLAEDYAFKASVARAYAGYREEASRLNDEILERRLFDVAIARLNEEPLRHVDKENESSPLKDLLGRFRFKRSSELTPAALAIALLEKEFKSEPKS